uniref:Protein HGH1 homolog n=1 Tax=Alexandrium monilatum TaxID=311494 RepID=A0A7S4Q8P8_9DINO
MQKRTWSKPGKTQCCFHVSAATERKDMEYAGVDEEEPEGEAEDGGGGAGAGSGSGALPEPAELLDLIEAIEGAHGDPASLAAVVRDIGRRMRLTPADRDMLSDFEGAEQLCLALGSPPNEWRGEAMVAFCKALPDMCRMSVINRGAFRDGSAIQGVVNFLRRSLAESDEAMAVAASVGLTALCTANDGNKREAAQLRGDFNEEELVETDADYRTPLFKDPEQAGALDLLLSVLKLFPASPALQTNACAALRTLLSDDDPRQASCVPSAVENRERAVRDEHFPAYRQAVETALGCEATGRWAPRLREQALLLLRELACRQDRIQELALGPNGARLLRTCEAALAEGDARVVRAGLAVTRALAFSDELKELVAVESNLALRCVAAVHSHVESPAICEQGFGLFANLTMRKPHIATRLNSVDVRVLAVGQLVLARYIERPNVVRSVLQTVRNVATQDEAAALELRESDILEEMRKLVVTHEGNEKWRSPVEIARQCLREFRADDGLQKAAQYNEYY